MHDNFTIWSTAEKKKKETIDSLHYTIVLVWKLSTIDRNLNLFGDFIYRADNQNCILPEILTLHKELLYIISISKPQY